VNKKHVRVRVVDHAIEYSDYFSSFSPPLHQCVSTITTLLLHAIIIIMMVMPSWLTAACIYPCIVGPDFWGLLSKNWRMCTQGLLQSPIDIQPSQLLYDPHLTPLKIDKHSVS